MDEQRPLRRRSIPPHIPNPSHRLTLRRTMFEAPGIHVEARRCVATYRCFTRAGRLFAFTDVNFTFIELAFANNSSRSVLAGNVFTDQDLHRPRMGSRFAERNDIFNSSGAYFPAKDSINVAVRKSLSENELTECARPRAHSAEVLSGQILNSQTGSKPELGSRK